MIAAALDVLITAIVFVAMFFFALGGIASLCAGALARIGGR